jgi:PAS domain S-box-containing protein
LNANRFRPQNPIYSLFTAIVFVAVFVFYADGIATQKQLANFSQHYADALLIGLVLISIGLQLRATASLVDPIYWLLLGCAFASWFGLTLMRIFFWQDFSEGQHNLLSSLAYFLFYSLIIAAIEVKSYQKAKELLTIQSLLIWMSTFCFTLGAFVFLVLTASQQALFSESFIQANFIFYTLMDIYLLLRWFHLAWVCRDSFWVGYFLFGLASLTWAVADIFEGLHIGHRLTLDAGSWHDWLWYCPYLFILIATQIKQSTSQQQNASQRFSRVHLFNSPLFFLIACFILHRLIANNEALLGTINSTQQTFYDLWFSVLLFFTTVHLLLLNFRTSNTEKELAEVNTATLVMQQRLLQQAQSLKEQAAANKTVLETTHNAIFTLDANGTIQSCNPAAARLLGVEQRQLIGEDFIDWVQADGELARYFTYQSYRQKIATQTGGVEIESMVTNQHGLQIPVHATLSQDQNSPEGLLVVSLVNISEQKKAELEALNLKDQFTANISHEFRTPLTIINGVLENLLAQEKYQADKPQLLTAKRNSLRMIRMVEQLLELSRIANDPLPVEPLNIQPEIEIICRSFVEIAKSQQIEYRFDLTDGSWVMGNPKALEKILFNLLSNAFKYTQQGTVTVTMAQQANHCHLTVTDTGIGMSEAELKDIFKRFHRVDSALTQSVPGVGIGLALVKELCDALRWTVQVTSAPGRGSCFTVSMPIAPANQIAKNQTDDNRSEPLEINKSLESEVFESKHPVFQSDHSKSKYSVLIVEDNPDMQHHINTILSPYHQCLLASNGEEGLRLAMDYLPDIVISDVMMPGISGFELLKTLKSTEMTTHIPVILLTARGDSASKIRGLESEADDYLSKPFDANELRLRVNNQLTSREKLQFKLASQWQQFAPQEAAEDAITDKFIVKLDAVFDEHYKDCDFTLVELSNTLAMSDRQVQRKVKALLGMSPLEALKQFRLKKARSLLERGDQIGVVAQTCGFSSQSYFGRCFKEAFGQTPKTFQQSFR